MIFVQVPTKHSKADLKIYRDAGAKVAAELAKHGTIERASIDEAYLDVTKEANAVLETVSYTHLTLPTILLV